MDAIFRHKAREGSSLFLGDGCCLGDVASCLSEHFANVLALKLPDQRVLLAAKTTQRQLARNVVKVGL